MMKEIMIISDNRVGIIAEISKVLSDAGINIDNITTVCSDAHHCTTVITTKHYDEALHTLQHAGFTAVTEDAFIIRLKDEPGSLAKISKYLQDADINIRSLQIVKREGGYSIVALATEKADEARKLLSDVLIA